MKTRLDLQKVVYSQQLDELRLPDLAVHLHIIVGANGKCMCGSYSGRHITCQEILWNRSQDIKNALSKEGVHYV